MLINRWLIERSVSQNIHRMCSIKNDIIKNFSKFTGKYLRLSLFFNKVGGLSPVIFIKKETLTQVFSCEFRKIFINTFFKEHLCETSLYCFLQDYSRDIFSTMSNIFDGAFLQKCCIAVNYFSKKASSQK